jgi:hypothetical protein
MLGPIPISENKASPIRNVFIRAIRPNSSGASSRVRIRFPMKRNPLDEPYPKTVQKAPLTASLLSEVVDAMNKDLLG